MAKPDLLILDEPTNHLDVQSIEWLEQFLKTYPGTCLFVTHDRYFLDRVTNRIVELANGTFFSHQGNYTAFLERKALRQANDEAQEAGRQKFLKRELEWVRRGAPARTTKSRDRVDRYHELAGQAAPEQELDMDLIIPPAPKLANRVIELKEVGVDLPDGRTLFDGVNLKLEAGQRLGIVGRNGLGKTTLLRVMLGLLPPTRGEAMIGTRTTINYVDQGRLLLDEEKTVFEEVGEGSEWVKLGDEQVSIRGYLGRFLFTGEQVNSKIRLLSGGERSRVILAKILKRGGNVIVLDEPTNDLDLATLRVLEEALVAFGGVVVAVSHDRYFLNRVCTSILAFEGGGELYSDVGNYDDYLAKRAAHHAEAARWQAQAASVKATPAATTTRSPGPRASSPTRRRRSWKRPRRASWPPRRTWPGWKRCSPRPTSTRSTATNGRCTKRSWPPPARKSPGSTRAGKNWRPSVRRADKSQDAAPAAVTTKVGTALRAVRRFFRKDAPAPDGDDLPEDLRPPRPPRRPLRGMDLAAKPVTVKPNFMRSSPSSEATMAVFLDLENIALGARDANYAAFDVRTVLEQLLLKGHIVVKKAYCDFDRYKDFKRGLHEAAFEMIEIPHVRQSGKNSADIRMVVDALDLCYTKGHVDTFAIISGDSDFSPLVSKLRENAKTVIGVGVKNSTSDLFINNCDEFIYYDDLVRDQPRRRSSSSRGGREQSAPPPASTANVPSSAPAKGSPEASAKAPVEKEKTPRAAKPEALSVEKALDELMQTLDALSHERSADDKIWASMIKQAIKRRNPGFNERAHGFRSFNELVLEAEKRGLLALEADQKNGGYAVRLVE